eukprot:14650-Pyramimonas_sp.AAC.2
MQGRRGSGYSTGAADSKTIGSSTCMNNSSPSEGSAQTTAPPGPGRRVGLADDIGLPIHGGGGTCGGQDAQCHPPLLAQDGGGRPAQI